MNRHTLLHTLWRFAHRPQAMRFRRALSHPAQTQARLLRRCLLRNASTVYGQQFGFDRIHSVADYQQRVPLVRYDALSSYIDRIRHDEAGVLTREPVRRLVPSSGSTAAAKLIPYTASLQREFGRAIGPWVCDLLARYPRLRHGPAYWSISPAVTPPDLSSAAPIGFDDDTDYLGGMLSRLVDALLVVPGCVRHAPSIDALRYLTLLCLLHARELRLISVWHPSFLTLLLSALPTWWPRLVRDVAEGTATPPGPVEPALMEAITRRWRPDPQRAAELRRLDPCRPADIWPALTLISCWGDGWAADAQRALTALLPNVAVQFKGLIATEAFVSLPYGQGYPLAVCSHFFEFIDDAGKPRTAEQIEPGGEYEVAVTTGGGLYRYRLGDRVRVDGRLAATPCIRFLGRADRVSDRCGEKLSEGFVTMVLERTLHHCNVRFAMLAPDDDAQPMCYTLYVEADLHVTAAALARKLDEQLQANPHYRYCRALGQLGPARVCRVADNAQQRYLTHMATLGQRLGDIKPTPLSSHANWRHVFTGRS
ncbi:MAG: GH3 auxin-responsive promoter family protein [Phycisphaeraceae bacterium]